MDYLGLLVTEFVFSDSSSSSSDESPARSVQSTAVPAPTSQLLPSLEKDEPRKSFGIKVQNLPVRSTDTSLKDGLFHEFKKYGKVTSVQIHGASEERYGLVFFRQQEDQEKALNASKGKLFFGMQIEVTAWVGPETESENEFRPLDERIDEFHPKATRTLFIGNLEKTTTYHDLRNIFQRFGGIVDIDIKKVNGVPQYAFLQYCDIASVCKAIKKMDGEYLGNNRLKLGFGKSMPTNCVWLDGLSTNVTDQYLTRHFCRYGPVVKVDFANRESQLAFYHSMEKTGQDIRDFYEMLAERRDERRGSYEYAPDRTYYETVRTPGTYPEDPRREYPARGREFYAEWDPYQGDYYDPRYYDDPREYREYRGDPYEQDIREYSYRQRERERERERFESDRDRDHERRPIERSQSPTHSRRPQSPGASPSQSERLQSDSERRIYSRSSDRSGSCSSLSPPRYDKLDKARVERYAKNEKPDKERAFDQERVDKDKRLVRKEKPEKLEKDKTEKQKRKPKNHSPSSQSSETDPENEREPSPEKLKGNTKQSKERADKEGTAKNRLELMPCVVLTRVKEKEGKVIDQPLEKPRAKLDNDTLKSPLEQKIQTSQVEQTKSDQSKLEPVRTKVPKEKVLASHVEVVDKEGKLKPKKHLKTEQTSEGANAVDLDKLEARKRRFADGNMKPDRQKLEVKRSSQDEEDARMVLKKQTDTTASSREVTVLREGELERKPLRKEILKRESKKIKLERLITVTSPKDTQEPANISVGIGSRPSSDLQARLGEPVDELIEAQDISLKKFNLIKQHKQIHLLDDQGTEREDMRKNYCLPEEMPDHKLGQEKLQSAESEEKIGIDIDHTQSYRKQMEQSRRLKQQKEMEMANSEKFGSPKKDIDEYERRSLVHEVGKPPQDVTDDSPPSKRKKTDHFDFEISTKRERNYRSSRQVSEDSERTACSPSIRHFPLHEDDDILDSPRLMPLKETKESPKIEEKGFSYANMTVKEDSLKFNPYDSSRREQMTEMAKIKLSVLSAEDESNRWESQVKQEPGARVDISFPSSIVKRDSIRKRSVRDLEPGEVPSDSDEDSENKPRSPKASSLLESSRLSSLLRDREEKIREREERLSTSLERNKFYSFALDKTITPDTKALLERAKSLSSSREENWSFLDWDSRFASFRNNKDKEKVDSAPRPIPSWYMKKKKIRTDSEGKLDDKKEDHKEEEQERQELFASRFLHSSIFEQDSKRLQHLERKDDDFDFISGRLYGRQTSLDGTNSGSDMVQEPVVLFHSRFIELTRMQQKEKEKDQKPKEAEKQEDKENRPKTPETVPDDKESEQKPSSVVGPSSVTAVPQEPAPAVPEKAANEKIVVDITSAREERPAEPTPAAEEPKPLPELTAPVKTEPPEQTEPPPVVEVNKDVVPTALASEEDAVSTEHPSYLDTKPPTPGASFSQADINIDPEPENPQSVPPPPPKVLPKSEESSEPKEENALPAANADPPANQKVEVVVEAVPSVVSDNDMEVEPPVVVKDKKSYKSKRSKTPVQSAAANVTEKPVTRKSERIDREKLKRSTSPRGEAQKHLEIKVEPEKVSRNAAKSPSAAAEPENVEPSLPVGRTRRRNVRSVYATTGDNEGPSPVKDSVEVTRSTRKRVEKEPQETVTTVPTTPRRGRPPKSRRKPEEDISPIKVEPVQQEADENETKETVETPKPAEGWRSPRSQKLAHGHSAAASGPQGKKGKNEPKADIVVEPEDAAETAGQESNVSETSNKSKPTDKEVAASDQKRDRKELEADKNPVETPTVEIVEKKPVAEKAPKSKRGRSRNVKTVDKAPLCLKNVEIRLNIDEVKGALRPSEEEAEPAAVSPAKIKSPPKEENVSPHFVKNEVENPFPEADKEAVREPKHSPEAAQLAKQIELEQAVEHIAKLTETPTIAPYKEQAADVSEVRQEEEGDKPAHQASETELAAAIGSIINDFSGETENFPAPPPYPAESESEIAAEPLVLPLPREEMEPETDLAVNNILETEAAVEPPAQPVPGSAPSTTETDSKEPEVSFSESSNSAQEAETLQEAEVSRKDRGRQKAARQRRKRSTSKKGDTAEVNVFEPERVPSKSPIANEVKAIPEEILKDEKQNKTSVQVPADPSASDAAKAAAGDVIAHETVTESSAPPKAPAAAAPAPLDLPSPPVPVDDVSQTGFKLRQAVENVPPPSRSAPNPAVPPVPPVPAAKILPPVPAGVVPLHSTTAKVSEWIVRHDDARARSTPPPALPPDTKASDIDTNSSTLRKILMEPKYSSAASITSTHVTTSIAEPVSTSRLEEAPPHPPVEAIKPVSEEKPAVPVTNALDPPVAEAPVFSEKEKISTVIAPKATSVISRMPHSVDLEETPRITLMKQAPQTQTCLVNAPSPKYKQKISTNDNSRFHPGSMSVIEDRPVETGSSPGLRVNTSEGVVLLSYSGQKTEGPQRISAKISQIPPASAVDIEFQQSVSKSQIKQEPITPSQPTPKGSQTPTGYGNVSTHSSLVLGTQAYNTSPVISSVKQERSTLEKSESGHLSVQAPASQSGPVKVLSQTVNTPPVLVHNQMVLSQNVASTNKKLSDPTALKVETKSLQPSNLSPGPDYRLHPPGIRLDQYNVARDVRMMMHSHMAAVGDHHPETRQSRTPDGSVKTPPVSKTPQPGKDAPKTSDVKMAHSPHNEPRLLSVPPSSQLLTQPVVVPHGVQIMHPTGSSFHDYRPVYGDMRNYHTAAQLGHPQFTGASPIGLPSRSMTPSQGLSEGEHSHPGQPVRSKTPQISQDSKGPQAAGPEQTHHTTELPSPHQPQAVPKQSLFIPTTSGPGAPPGLPLTRPEPQSALKQDPSLHPVSQRPVDMVQLLTKYPIVWQGLLALKNDTAAVQLHFVSGNNVLAHRSLPAPEGGPPLRIAQRMRLEASQLEGVARRMMVESDYCLLLALPCGRDQEDVVSQTESLKAAFISYLQAKQAAGIINVPNPGSNQPAYVLQIFPPCEFSENHLSRLAPDLLASISNISPHLMIVIASV
ncbi:msx2-interacting protein [Alligator mississippiensis]|uniref:Msx2-interacting protein n=1 Tax=Alligator mississippiensis TaxID=8496 RepID=A0A151MJ97_ALLMI|nr:msx2-interacting protein [Alligator mississippiensis]